MARTKKWASQEDLTNYGPLGCENMRQAAGMGAVLGQGQPQGLKVRLIDASMHLFGDSLAQSMTVTCGLSPDDRASASRAHRVEGILEWGTQGVQQTARFDWVNGTVVRLVSASVQLTAELLPPLTEETPGTEAIAKVLAHVGYGTPVSGRGATLTRRGVSVGLAGVSFVVPSFANAVSLFFSGTCTLTWFTRGGASLTGPFTVTPSESYPVPNSAYSLLATPSIDGGTILCIWALTI